MIMGRCITIVIYTYTNYNTLLNQMQYLTINMVIVMNNNFSTGSRIRELRMHSGMSQEQIALKAEITTAYLGMIERGEKNPTVIIVEKICNALAVSLAEFFSPSYKPHSEMDETTLQILQQLNGKSTEEKQVILTILKQIFKIQTLGK